MQKKKKMQYDQLMAEGMTAKDDKNYTIAAQRFQAALLVMPNDGPASKALIEIGQFLSDEEKAKQKGLAFQFYMDAGNAALAKQDYLAAKNNFVAALGVIPGSPDAIKGMKKAEDLLDAAQDKAKKQAEVQGLIAQGRDARKMQLFDQAIDAFQKALKIMPDDRDAQQGLDEATKALAKVKTDYRQLMVQGENAMQLQRFEEALKNYQAALLLIPNDPAALRGIALRSRDR